MILLLLFFIIILIFICAYRPNCPRCGKRMEESNYLAGFDDSHFYYCPYCGYKFENSDD